MSKLYIALLVLFSIIVLCFCLVLPVLAQSPVDNAQATISAATAQAQQAQWNRQAEATRQAQSLLATTQAIAIEAEATRQAIIINASATAQAQSVQLDVTRQAHLGNVAATATIQAMQAEYQATQASVALLATRQAYDISLAEMKERSDIGTMLLYFSAVLSGIGLLSVLVWALGKLPKSTTVKQVEIIDATYTATPLLLPAPNTLTITELPDNFENVIEELIDNGE